MHLKISFKNILQQCLFYLQLQKNHFYSVQWNKNQPLWHESWRSTKLFLQEGRLYEKHMRHDAENLKAARYIPNVPLTTFCSAECYIKNNFYILAGTLKEMNVIQLKLVSFSLQYVITSAKTAPSLLLTFIFSFFQR